MSGVFIRKGQFRRVPSTVKVEGPLISTVIVGKWLPFLLPFCSSGSKMRGRSRVDLLQFPVDWCSSKKLVNKVQRVMNCAARLVCKAPKRERVIPLLVDLHWLPVECRIEYKIATICYNVITGTAPPYLSDLLELCIPSRTLRSSADTRIFRIPNRYKRFQGQRAFSFIGLSIWNNLPFSVRHAKTLSAFKSPLKTHLFFFSLYLVLLLILALLNMPE